MGPVILFHKDSYSPDRPEITTLESSEKVMLTNQFLSVRG